MSADDLVTFLLERLNEDERDARETHREGCDSLPVSRSCCGDDDCYCEDYTGPCDCGVPTRVLREVAAKRAIVDLHREARAALDDAHSRLSTKAGWPDWGDAVEREEESLEIAVTTVAAIYADHPDYRQEWKQ